MVKLSKDHQDGPTAPPLMPLSPVHVHTQAPAAEPLITQCQCHASGTGL